MNAVRFWLALALLTPAAAHADPISIFIALEAVIGATLAAAVVTVGSWVVANAVYIALAYNVYSSVSARRAAKRAANEAREAYNRSLQDRTITALSAEPPERYFYGTGVTGGDVVAIFTSDKVKDGKVKKDGYKHIVIVTTSHRIKAIKDILIDGVRLGITGTTGWATAGEFAKSAEWDKTETADISATSLTLSEPVFAILSVTAKRGGGRIGLSWPAPYTLVGNTINFAPGTDYPGAQSWTVVYTVADPNNSTVYAEKFLGTSTQTANAYLMDKVPGQWTSTDRLQGRSGVVITLDLEEPRFQGGVPRLSFDIEGRDEILDPRDSTLKYTTNPALCIDDWLRSTRWGFGVTPDVDSTIEAANACDVSTTFGTLHLPTDGIGPPFGSSFTGPRYTLNGGWTAADDKETVLGQMAAAMGGRVIDGASWLIQAGAWTAPVVALVDGDEAGPIQVLQTGESIDDIFNSVRASYLPAASATVADMNPPYQNSTFVTADGRELWEVMTMPFTDQASRVRNLARIAVETARNGLVIQYPAKLKAWEVRPGQRVTITNAEFAWTAKTFRVTDWQFGLRGAVVLTLIEDAEDAWDLADAAIVDPTPNTGLPNPNLVDPIEDLDADSGTAQLLPLDDGTIVPRVLATWTQSDSPYMDNGRVEVAWRNVLDTDWTLVNAAGSDTSAYLLGVLDGSVILLRVTAYNSLGVASTPAYLEHAVLGKSAAPSDVSGLTATVLPGAVHITWNLCTDVDYDHTVLRYGASWAAGVTLPFNSAGDSYDWPWPAPGTYTVWAANVDTTGNVSATPTSTSVAVTVTALAPANGSLGIKLNVGDFAGTVNYNEAYIHGRNSSGAAVDAPGTILVNGVAVEIPNGLLYTNFGPASGYVMWDMAGSTFSVLGSSTRPYVLARRFQGEWQYDDNNAGSWTVFTPTATHLVIGTLASGAPDAGNPGSAPGLIAASMWAVAETPNAIAAAVDSVGLSTALVFIYQRGASGAPALPSASATYTFATGALTGLNNGWSTSPPGGTDPMYVSVATASSSAASDTIASGEWAAAVLFVANGADGTDGDDGSDGVDGDDGINAATIYLFQRTTGSGAPALPSAPVTYTFATGVAAGADNGWVQALPTSGGAYRWVTTASALSSSSTDTISSGEWAAAAVLAQDGSDGTAGLNNALVQIYQRSTGGAPALPSATATYTFASAALTGLNNGWSATPPAGTDPLYVSVATASSSSSSDTIASGEWASVVLLAASGADGNDGNDGTDGNDGNNGLNAATVYLFQRTGSASAPALPSASVTYTFSTGAASGVDNGWAQTLPTSGGAYRWVTTASALSTGSTDTIASGEWAAAALLAQDGADGADGADGTDGNDGQDAIAMTLSSAAVALPADSTGLVSDYSTATTTAKVMRGGSDDTSNWTLSRTNGAGVTSSLSTATLTVTALTGDTGYVDITATRTGFATQTVRFTLTKAKGANPASGPVSAAGFYEGYHVTFSPNDCSCYVEFKRDGSVWTGHNPSTNTQSGNWYLPNGSTVGDAYEIRFDQIATTGLSGGLSGATVAAWLPLSSAQGLTLATTENSNAVRIRKFTYVIRDASSQATVCTGTFNLDAEVEL